MSQLIIFARTDTDRVIEDLVRSAQFYHRLGNTMAILAFVILIGGVIGIELQRRWKRKKNEKEESGKE